MRPFHNCPVCGGEWVEKTIEKLLRGGSDIAVLNVEAEVCLKCGKRLYSKGTIELFNEIREKLVRGDVAEMEELGRSYKVA